MERKTVSIIKQVAATLRCVLLFTHACPATHTHAFALWDVIKHRLLLLFAHAHADTKCAPPAQGLFLAESLADS